MAHVFISYVREDTPTVNKLASELESRGVKVWLDRNDISVGVRWADAIKNAIRQGSFFLACFSNQFHNKPRTYMNEELTLAIEELRLRPTDRAWFLPVLLDDCNIPDRSIGAGESIADIQYASLFADWNEGLSKILAAVGKEAGEAAKGSSERKKTIQQLAVEFFERNRSPYQEHIRAKGRRLVDIVISLPNISIEENQKWLLWELFHSLHETKKYNCTEAWTGEWY